MSLYLCSGDSVDPEGDSTLTQAMKRFTGDRKSPSLEIVKGTLLATADQILSTLSELVIENAQYDRGKHVCSYKLHWCLMILMKSNMSA